MKIAVYDQPFTGSIGGAETCVITLAEALSKTGEHSVDILHHVEGFEKQAFARFAGADLERVNLRYVPREPDPYPYRHNPVKRYSAVPRWHAALSEGYDVFFPFTHEVPPFCHARLGVLSVLFPSMAMAARPDRADGPSEWKSGPTALFVRDEWRRRMATYQVRSAISQYTKDWTTKRWNINCDIVYPPVRSLSVSVGAKRPQILSVGRFTGGERSKRQREVMEVWASLEKEAASLDWHVVCAGAVGNEPGERDYFESVQEKANGLQRAHVRANLPRSEVEGLYAESGIYWHLSGLGGDDVSRPDLAEHFGITTVEAMSAGCVPVVIRKGGQPELVEHGVTGFVWDTLDELQAYTLQLMGDPALQERMSLAARKASQKFQAEHFIAYYQNALRPLSAHLSSVNS